MLYELGGLLAFVSGWLVSQLCKLALALIDSKGTSKIQILKQTMMKSGGMPSGHTASFVALITFLGLKNAWTSDIFILALCVGFIVIYDAVNVRWAVGRYGAAINELRAEGQKKKRALKVVEGHTVIEVVMGTFVGILIGVLVHASLWAVSGAGI